MDNKLSFAFAALASIFFATGLVILTGEGGE